MKNRLITIVGVLFTILPAICILLCLPVSIIYLRNTHTPIDIKRPMPIGTLVSFKVQPNIHGVIIEDSIMFNNQCIVRYYSHKPLQGNMGGAAIQNIFIKDTFYYTELNNISEIKPEHETSSN